MCGQVHRRTGPVMTKATMRLVYNAVGIYAPGHARYKEVDLYTETTYTCYKKYYISLDKIGTSACVNWYKGVFTTQY